MPEPVIISCAVTGGADSTGKSPYVPVTPQQIADQAIAAAEAGAAVVHIHVRDPRTGQPSVEYAHYEEVVERIRAARSPVLINLTTGPGAMAKVESEGPFRISGGRAAPLMTPAERVAHILRLKPEICSLDVATMNFGEACFINSPDHLRQMAALLADSGVVPELEVFDLGHIRLARHLIETGALKGPGYFQFCLGVPWGAPANAKVLDIMRDMLPEGALWSAFGIARDQFPIVAAAPGLGGNVRVGLEDNLYLAPGQLAKHNAELVEKSVRILSDLGYNTASPEEARIKLGVGLNH